ncbi:MAG TPA: hypothetical protein VHZ03_32060 [Trebonia sp.]|jgi:hypothetical protein|nr:hypothetical protein [Trebonia sp.]
MNKVPQYISTYRAITVGITLFIMAFVLFGDVFGPLAAMFKGI